MRKQLAWRTDAIQLMELGLKRCPDCEEIKPATTEHFYKNEYAYDGLSTSCKICRRGYEYKNNHSEKQKQARRDYRKNNPAKVKQITQRRRARKYAGGSFTSEEWETLCKSCNFLCLACGEQKPLTPDHVIPLAKGGTNDISNIQPLCLPCNISKGTKTIDYRPN